MFHSICGCLHTHALHGSHSGSSSHSDVFTSAELRCFPSHPLWDSAETEIKVPSVENSELTNFFPRKAWRRSEYSHGCFAHCQEFLHCSNSYLHFFSPNPLHTFSLLKFWLTPFTDIICGMRPVLIAYGLNYFLFVLVSAFVLDRTLKCDYTID